MEKKNSNSVDNSMAMYITGILVANPYIPMSWGYNSPKALENGLQFKVRGFKFNGFVQVIYDEITDLFIVKFLEDTKDMELVYEFIDVYLDQLISIIDKFVEVTENYEKDLGKWLKTFED